ncbi:MAG TPA: family 20 glycosylhydrolase [Bacteroidales bacterium]|nr:family 20 glycosylhydrolase [Bacteroidales bacterium]
MKKTLYIIFLILSLSGYSNSFDKYLIPFPKNIKIVDENNKPVYCDAEAVEVLEIFTSIKEYNSTSKLILPNLIYDLHSLKMGIDSINLPTQAYYIKIDKNTISILGQSEAAIFYAKQTILQLLSYCKTEKQPIPCVSIKDYPDFERRGYMLDISRDKVPTMETLYSLIDLLASLKINEFQLYTEHTFAYKNHKVVWENSSPMTAEEIQELDIYCKERYIDLVPNQNSFGHMENWLKHDEYLELAECTTTVKTIWGPSKRHSLDPTNPKSFELMQELYNELLPNFTSEYFNIGCDETVELGLGRSAPQCKKQGKGRVYLDYLLKLNEEVNKQGKKTQFWGDIIVNHPELIDELPKNMIALVWGYDDKFSAGKDLSKFVAAGLDFYVCPGTSAWNSLIGRNQNAFENLKNAAIQGKKYFAKGYLITSWGDNGHWQPMSVTYPALLLGTAYAWNYNENTLKNLEFLLNHYVFKDNAGNTAKAILKLGYAETKTNIPNGNANAFHLMLYRYKWTMDGFYQTKELNIEGLEEAEKEIIAALDILKDAKPQSKDSAIIISETEQAANLALHGIHLGIARLYAKDKSTENIPKEVKKELIAELNPLIENYKKLWIVRNKPGGLKDSAGKLENLLNYYKK